MIIYPSWENDIRQIHNSKEKSLTVTNMPERKTKKEETRIRDSASRRELAEVTNHHLHIELIPDWSNNSERLHDICIQDTQLVQAKSKLHSAHVALTAVHLQNITWCIHQPGHGQFIKTSKELAIPAKAYMATEFNEAARSSSRNCHKASAATHSLNHWISCKITFQGKVSQRYSLYQFQVQKLTMPLSKMFDTSSKHGNKIRRSS